jgi:hypothetical protein
MEAPTGTSEAAPWPLGAVSDEDDDDEIEVVLVDDEEDGSAQLSSSPPPPPPPPPIGSTVAPATTKQPPKKPAKKRRSRAEVEASKIRDAVHAVLCGRSGIITQLEREEVGATPELLTAYRFSCPHPLSSGCAGGWGGYCSRPGEAYTVVGEGAAPR